MSPLLWTSKRRSFFFQLSPEPVVGPTVDDFFRQGHLQRRKTHFPVYALRSRKFAESFNMELDR
mgnify:CR=1 FL=1